MSFKSATRNHKAISYQSLEGRRLLAGNVTVFENVNLYIRGDAADNQFEVVTIEDRLEIHGLNGTTINGKDSYVVAGANVTNSGITFEGGLRAHLGPGSDDFSVVDAQFESMSLIYGGTGDDDVVLIDSHFTDDATIQTFHGDDSIEAIGSQFDAAFRAITLDGQDSVSMVDSTMNGNAIVATGEHSDTIHSRDSHYMGEVNLFLPLNGDDLVQIKNPVVGESQLGVFLGNGDDTFHGDFMEGKIDGRVRIGGQAGNDRGDMSMNEEADSKVSVTTIEDVMLFDGGVEGAANILAGIDTYSLDSKMNERYATPVAFDSAQDVGSIEWTGTYFRDATPVPDPSVVDRGDSFVIEVYEDAGDGAPDSSSVVRFEVGSANRVDSGETATQRVTADTTFEYPIYEYSADIDFTMEADKQYWFSIYTEIDDVELAEHNFWGWGYAFDQISEAVKTQGFDPSDGTVDSNWRYISDDGPRPNIQPGLNLDFRLRSKV